MRRPRRFSPNTARPLGSDRISFESRARYAFNDGLTDWEQLQLTLGFEVEF